METYSTYESLRQHFEALARAGYFKIVMKDVSRTKRLLHDFYRSVVWFLVILYNIQHVISVFQARGDTGKLADTLFILLTTLGCLGKQAAFNLRSRRIERLLSIVNGPLFAATTPHDIEVLKQNALNMSRILKLYQVSVITCGTTMAIFPFFNRAQGKQVQFTGYVPIDTKSPTIFTIILLYMTFSVTFQGYANVSQDCTIVAFYAVARVQIQMLRYNLEHLADGSVEEDKRIYLVKNGVGDDQKGTSLEQGGLRVYRANEFMTNGNFEKNQDNNMLNEDKSGVLQRRLGKCVEHYRQIAWFCKEIESIFFEALFFQFLIMAWVICMTVYKIVGLNLLSVEFVSMLAYLMCILAQLFLYCYYGTQFKNESGYINQSVYFSNWMSLSPAFRRQLLVIMEYCLPPITPSIAYVVPMTLETFISVLRSSYTLFTVLDRQ